MKEELKVCPICNNDVFKNHLVCTDHFLTGEKFTITKCSKCSLLFTNPRPTPNQLHRYYKSQEYISHSNKGNNLINRIYKLARHFTLSGKIKLINTITNQKSILDVGCGTGNFLLSCKKNGWDIYGTEPDDDARKIATELTDANIVSDLDKLADLKNLGLITLWHVLEHLPDLNTTINHLVKKIDKTGKLLIAVPNHQSYDAQFYKDHWAAYDVPRHLYHFSRNTMELLLNKHGLNIYNILPMKLDSFYVSLLSEKYRNQKSNYLKSFTTAYKSNIYAKKNNNYSSLIYIAGK
ncbi:MAG: class I SAM-dependent methyltransferase [Cytophagales bacterium]|nr:class I SAM-dependent methyltransferase [Cytophagales bacterium]